VSPQAAGFLTKVQVRDTRAALARWVQRACRARHVRAWQRRLPL